MTFTSLSVREMLVADYRGNYEQIHGNLVLRHLLNAKLGNLVQGRHVATQEASKYLHWWHLLRMNHICPQVPDSRNQHDDDCLF